jgi:hypothetical protein
MNLDSAMLVLYNCILARKIQRPDVKKKINKIKNKIKTTNTKFLKLGHGLLGPSPSRVN